MTIQKGGKMKSKTIKIISISVGSLTILILALLIPILMKNRAISICQENIASADKKYCSEAVSYLPKIRKESKENYSLISKNNLNRIFNNMWDITTADACIGYGLCYLTDKGEALVNLNILKSPQEKTHLCSTIEKEVKKEQAKFIQQYKIAKQIDLNTIEGMQNFVPGYGNAYKKKLKVHEQKIAESMQDELDQSRLYIEKVKALGTPYTVYNEIGYTVLDEDEQVDLRLIASIIDKFKSYQTAKEAPLGANNTETVEEFFNGCGCINLDTEIIPQVKKECKQGDTVCYQKVEERLCKWN